MSSVLKIGGIKSRDEVSSQSECTLSARLYLMGFEVGRFDFQSMSDDLYDGHPFAGLRRSDLEEKSGFDFRVRGSEKLGSAFGGKDSLHDARNSKSPVRIPVPGLFMKSSNNMSNWLDANLLVRLVWVRIEALFYNIKFVFNYSRFFNWKTFWIFLLITG